MYYDIVVWHVWTVMQVYRCVVYQDGTMNLALLVAHAYAASEQHARLLMRKQLTDLGIKMHLGQLAMVRNFPLSYFVEKPVKLTRYTAGF